MHAFIEIFIILWNWFNHWGVPQYWFMDIIRDNLMRQVSYIDDEWIRLCQTRFLPLASIHQTKWCHPRPLGNHGLNHTSTMCGCDTIYWRHIPFSFRGFPTLHACLQLVYLISSLYQYQKTHQASNLLRSEYWVGNQDETEWGQTTTIPVIPVEHSCSYLPLTTGRLSHQSDNKEIACQGSK